MTYTISTIAQSLATYLAQYFPDVTFYEDPNQQGTDCPCMFLQQRYSYITRETGLNWYLRKVGLDLTYLIDYNLPNMQKLYLSAAETLDSALDNFPYTDGTTNEPELVRTYDREWRVDLDALHYKFEVRERVYIPVEENKMRTMDYDEVIKNG